MAEMNNFLSILRLNLKNTMLKKCIWNYLFSNFCCFIPMGSFSEKVCRQLFQVHSQNAFIKSIIVVEFQNEKAQSSINER